MHTAKPSGRLEVGRAWLVETAGLTRVQEDLCWIYPRAGTRDDLGLNLRADDHERHKPAKVGRGSGEGVSMPRAFWRHKYTFEVL